MKQKVDIFISLCCCWLVRPGLACIGLADLDLICLLFSSPQSGRHGDSPVQSGISNPTQPGVSTTIIEELQRSGWCWGCEGECDELYPFISLLNGNKTPGRARLMCCQLAK